MVLSGELEQTTRTKAAQLLALQRQSPAPQSATTDEQLRNEVAGLAEPAVDEEHHVLAEVVAFAQVQLGVQQSDLRTDAASRR